MLNKDIYLEIWKTYKKEKILFFYNFIELLSYMIGLLSIEFNKKLINYIKNEKFDFVNCLYLVFLYLFFSIFLNIFLRAFNHNYHLICEKIAIRTIKKNFSWTIQHSINYFNNNLSGYLTSKVTDSGFIYRDVLLCFRDIILFLFRFSFYFIYCCTINFYVSIFLLFSFTIYFLFQKKSAKLQSLKNKRKSNQTSKYYGFIVDLFLNIINVKTFSRNLYEKINSKKHLLNILRTDKKIIKIKQKKEIILIVSLIPVFFLYIYIAFLLTYKKINIGEFYAIISIISRLTNHIWNYINKLNNFNNLKERYFSGIKTIYKPIQIQDKTNKKLKIINGNITFKNMSFSYEK